MLPPTAICFDLGYTLLRHSPTGPELYRRLLAEDGIEVSLEDLEAAHVPAREHILQSVRRGLEFEASMDAAAAFWMDYTIRILRHVGVREVDHSRLAERINTTA